MGRGNTEQNLQEKIRAQADAWLEQAGESGYELGACYRKEGSWYAVEVDGGETDYRVYVRLTPEGSEVRDDRVLAALSREMTAITAEQVPETALCLAWVGFCAGMPAQRWYPTDTLDTVTASEALCTDWYLLVPAAQAELLPELAAGLAVDLRQRDYVGTLHAAAVEEAVLGVLRAGTPEQEDLAAAAERGSWVRVSPEDVRTREELAQEIRRG